MSTVEFQGKILLLGAGAVAQCMLPLLFKHIIFDPKNLTIITSRDNRDRIHDILIKGVSYVIDTVTKENMPTVLSKYVGNGDLIIDLAVDIDCVAILAWCHENQVLYCNTSVEVWNPYVSGDEASPLKSTLYERHMAIRALIKSWSNPKKITAVIDHGANPGLVSHFTKIALEDIARKIIQEKPNDPRIDLLQEYLRNKNYPKLAQTVGVKVIHISERDTQITRQPKEVNEFVNTWSIDGLAEEGLAPSELGWGTHERRLPDGALFHSYGPGNQICIAKPSIQTWVRSWVPSGPINGMVIRHGEAFTISNYLTVWNNDKTEYRPTVHYAYMPCDAAVNSLQELIMSHYKLQPRQRILEDDIISGADEVGVLLMGHDFTSWWTGSVLDIEQTRRLAPHQNATTLQVACSLVAALMWMLKNPHEGVCVPDDLPAHEILTDAKPYLGSFISQPVDWTPLKHRITPYKNYTKLPPAPEDVWQFTSFLC
jgi:homospermidine synthase